MNNWDLVLGDIHADGGGTLIGLENAYESISELKHVGSKRDDNKLGVLGPLADVGGYDGDVAVIEGSVDLVHYVNGCGPIGMEGKDECKTRESLLTA